MPETRLPSSWEACRLGDVVDYGATQKAEPTRYRPMPGYLSWKTSRKIRRRCSNALRSPSASRRATKNGSLSGTCSMGQLRPVLE